MKDSTLSAKEAAEALGIRLETLYAYVSRGQIRSRKVAGSRRRRYVREDVERMAERREVRQRPERLLDDALYFGAPLLDSSITLIQDGRCYYRGRDAVEISRRWTFERAAAWLWGPALAEPPANGTGDLFGGGVPGGLDGLWERTRELKPVERFQVALPWIASRDPAAWDFRPAAVARTGARLLRALGWLTVGPTAAGSDVSTGLAATLARGWGCGDAALGLLDACLVLSMDHELNVSAFTARCVASSGSTPYAAVNAAFGALQGTRHGGHTRRVEALLREAALSSDDSAVGVREAIAGRLQRGEPVPGYGQPLYPDGDPRCQELLRRVEEGWPESTATAEGRALERVGRELLGEHVALDVGLVVASRALGLPDDAALTLFALGRTAGWIGHIFEQYADPRLIRPRARYVGEPV